MSDLGIQNLTNLTKGSNQDIEHYLNNAIEGRVKKYSTMQIEAMKDVLKALDNLEQKLGE